MKPKKNMMAKSATKEMNNECHKHSKQSPMTGTVKVAMNGVSIKSMTNGSVNGMNGHHHSVPNHPNHYQSHQNGHQNHGHNRSRSQSQATPTAKQVSKQPSGLPLIESNNSFVTNTRPTPHSYPKTSQMSSLLSSTQHEWSQQSSGDPLSQSHVRFAGSRFTEAPNPSLLPKPPQHWMSANAINTLAINSTNGFDAKHNSTPDNNAIALKLREMSRHMTAAVGANSIAYNGLKYDSQAYVN